MEINRPIAIIFLIITIVFFIFFLVSPKHHEFKILQGKAAEKEAEYKARSEYYFRIKDLFEDLEKREKQRAKIDSMIPTKLDLSSLLYFLEKKAEENGVSLLSVKFLESSPLKDEESPGAIQENFFLLKTISTYSAFKNFLSVLEKSSRLIEIDSISFSPKSEEEGEIKSFEFKIKVYSL